MVSVLRKEEEREDWRIERQSECACITAGSRSTYLSPHTLAVLGVGRESVPVTIVQHGLCGVSMSMSTTVKNNEVMEGIVVHEEIEKKDD